MDVNIRILVVDDEPDIRQLLRILLENRGYQVVEAASGEEAVRRLRTDPAYDLILMDIMMPGMDGVAACQAIRSFFHGAHSVPHGQDPAGRQGLCLCKRRRRLPAKALFSVGAAHEGGFSAPVGTGCTRESGRRFWTPASTWMRTAVAP